MATRRPVRPSAPVAAPATSPPARFPRLAIEYVNIDHDIRPYADNPRDNAEAIKFVAASIQQFGFLVPIVIDDNGVLVAGHTRVGGARSIGMMDVPAVRARGLTQDQIDQFRLIDNKVAEQSVWDNDLLAREISRLSESGIEWTAFGWNQEEIDCLHDVVRDDCLNTEDLAPVNTDANNQRRAPEQVRFVLGEVFFFLPATTYRAWVDGLRAQHNFSNEAIVADLQRRLGILR